MLNLTTDCNTAQIMIFNKYHLQENYLHMLIIPNNMKFTSYVGFSGNCK